MPCVIYKQKLGKYDVLDHYWLEHRELILQKIRVAAERRSRAHREQRRLEQFAS